MGPPTNVDGEIATFARVAANASWLQWGRRQTSTESVLGG